VNWKYATVICLAVVGLLTGVYYLGRHTMAVEVAGLPAVRDTVTVTELVPVAAPVVTPNPSQGKPRPDPTLKVRVDSLIAAVANKDSLIRGLVSTVTSQQNFRAGDPTGLTVSGIVCIEYDPLNRLFWTDMVLDSIRIPVRTVTITVPPIIEKEMAWPWIFGALGAGVVVGALL
jgi:hypothetical protein